MACIYQVKNTVNNKKYIGQTRQSLAQRKRNHKILAKTADTYFYRAIRKYGWESFEWSILEDNIDPIMLNEREIFWIKTIDTFHNGYNSNSGGNQAFEISDATRKKLSIAGYGRKHSEESKRKMSIVQTGKVISPKQREKARLNQLGKKHSKETKKKMSLAHKGKEHTRNRLGSKLSEAQIKARTKLQADFWEVTNPKSETFIVQSLHNFCIEHNLSCNALYLVAQNKQKTHRGWKCKKLKKESIENESTTIRCC